MAFQVPLQRIKISGFRIHEIPARTPILRRLMEQLSLPFDDELERRYAPGLSSKVRARSPIIRRLCEQLALLFDYETQSVCVTLFCSNMCAGDSSRDATMHQLFFLLISQAIQHDLECIFPAIL